MLLTSRPDWSICGEAANGLEAVDKAAQLKPDVVIMDVSMPEMDGMEATRCILKQSPAQKIVIYTMHESEAFTSEAIRAGAQAVVRKSGDAHRIVNAVDAVLDGKQFFPGEAHAAAAGMLMSAPDQSNREGSPR